MREAKSKDDWLLIESWLAQERIWRYLGPPFTNGGFRQAAIAFGARNGSALYFLAFSDNSPVGFVALSDISIVHQRANVWYALGVAEYAGRGIMKEACRRVIDYAFRIRNLHSLYAWAINGNDSSMAILRGNGFRQYGTQRQAFGLDGKFVDVLWFDLLSPNQAGPANSSPATAVTTVVGR